MQSVIAFVILVLGLVNILRMSIFMVLGDWYPFFMAKKGEEKRTRKKTYHPLVSVVIAAYNEEHSISRTLRSVAASNYKNLEIIVVDDGSRDATAGKVRKFITAHPHAQVTLLQEPNGGKARALNYGIKTQAHGSLIMTLDADSLIASDGIARAVRYFRNPRIKAVAANVRILKSQTLLGLMQYIEYLVGYHLKKSYTVLSMEYIIGGIGSMFRKSTLRSVGWYDTDTVTEDIDVTMKIISRGNRINQVVYGADVLTYTQPVQSFPDLFRQRFRWKFGRFQTMFKNKGMLFNLAGRYTKGLTFFQLPFVFYSELTFLFDPLFFGFILFVSLVYQDASSLQWIIYFYGFYTAVTILSDSHSGPREKMYMLAVAPLAYLFFFTISLVEYAALWKCLLEVRGIIRAREIDICSWEHVERPQPAV